MKITLLNIGKTESEQLEGLIVEYVRRVNRFVPFQSEYIMQPKNIGKMKPEQLKQVEGELILKKCAGADYIVLLDEKGKQYSSETFSKQLQKNMNKGFKNIFFVTGGAFGFSQNVYTIANEKLSLSPMTTTHQLIRLFFCEQLYRAFTILKGHPYHNA